MPKKVSKTPSPPLAIATLETMEDVRRGVVALKAACPILARVHAEVGDPPLRRRAGGFPGLARIIVGQQLSIASADAIWRRVEAAVMPFDVATLHASSDADLKAAGLSAAKIRTLQGLAEAIIAGRIAPERLEQAAESEVRSALCSVAGIGPWTADIYMMFCQGRADAFAPGDLALQEGVRMARRQENRPSVADLSQLAERWRPWRAVAACIIWHAYAHWKRR